MIDYTFPTGTIRFTSILDTFDAGERLVYRTLPIDKSFIRSLLMNFVKTSLLGGLFVLLPLMLLWIGIREIADLLAAMATPIADLLAGFFPGGFFDNLRAPGAVAFLLIAGVSLVLGVAARSEWISSLGRRFESAVLFKVPMYRMLKIISSALIDTDSSDVDAALLLDGSGGGDPCYVIEKHADGRATILIPWSPASFAGSIKVVQQSNLEILHCSIDEYSRAISQIGVGVEECMHRPPSKTKSG